jgi:catechol 2,3-dioxygenase-like lactoylglutathione lyase family enzyme
MSRIAIVSENFRTACEYYGEKLGFEQVKGWERPDARGAIFDLCGLQLELLDLAREKTPPDLGDSVDRIHIVIEVEDIKTFHAALPEDMPELFDTSWAGPVLELHDPHGIPVTILQRPSA